MKLKKIRILVLLSIVTLFVPIIGFTSTLFFAYNWGSSEGVEKALDAVKLDSVETTRGFEIGQNFWKSLFNSQSFADHKAGDGLYFSTQPLDSARFGPSLLIVEIQIADLHDEKLLKVMTGEQAQVHPKFLPTIVRYRGSWHVIKSLPKDDRVKIWIRKPTSADVDKIFQDFELDTNKFKVLDLITQVGSRYAAHFRRFEKARSIPEDQRDNLSTQKFMTHLISQLVERGLNFQASAISSGAVDMDSFSKQLTHTLHTLRQVENENVIYGFNMTKAIYKKILSQPSVWTPDILRTLRFYHEEYFNRYIKNSARPLTCLALF